MIKKANASDLLGINARNSLYVSRNSRKAKAIARSKYATKILLNDHDIPCAKIYGILGTGEDINDFAWEKLEGDFVIKPTNGHAGTGVIAFRKKVNKEQWLDVLGNKWDLDDIKLHCRDILTGQYSIHGSNHNIIIEERIPIHPKLLKYSYRGTPDVRVIVFNRVPVMAMLRLPTEESSGRANVSQGAIAVGIDLSSGITTYAVAHKKQIIKYLPGTKKKLNGIVIPNWQKVLLSAVRASEAADLIYCGVDVFLHKIKGPMIVELNATPGLSIQAANQAGLRRRLERVEGLNVVNAEHGVKIAQALFASDFSNRIKVKSAITNIGLKEEIVLYGEEKQRITTNAFINTGRLHSAIARDLAGKLGLLDVEDLLWFQKEKEEGNLPVINIKIKLRGQIIKSTMLISKKLNHRLHKVEIGRKDLDGFIISPGEND